MSAILRNFSIGINDLIFGTACRAEKDDAVAEARKLLQEELGVYNVTDYGADPTGANDCSQAVVDTLAAMPDSFTPGTNSRTAGMGILFFPPGRYLFLSTVQTPVTKNFDIRGAAGMRGSLIEGPPSAGPNYAFDFTTDSQFKERGIRELMFYRIGMVTVEDQSRNTHVFERFFVKGAPQAAIQLRSADGTENTDSGIVGGTIRNFEIEECEGGIQCQGGQADNWKIEHGQFTRNTGGYCPDVQTSSSGWRLYDLYFEQRGGSSANQDIPFVNIFGPLAAGLLVLGCRFGNEIAATSEPPREAITVGKIGQTEIGHLSDVRILFCRFRGRSSPGPTATSANSAIRFNIGPRMVKIMGNLFFEVFDSLIEFAHGNNHHGIGNTLHIDAPGQPVSNGNAKLFSSAPSRGPVGSWRVIGDDRSHVDFNRTTEQLIARTENAHDPTGWTKLNGVVTKDATGPNKSANTAYTFTKSGSGTASLSTSFTLAQEETICCSVWLRKPDGSDIDHVRFYTTGMNSNEVTVPITSEWRQWYYFGPKNGSTSWNLGAGEIGGSETGAFEFAYPQAEFGEHPTPYLARLDGVTRTRQGGSVPFANGRYASFGTSQPVSGSRLQGDWHINSLPGTGEPAFWVCTADGVPGTWTPGTQNLA